MINITLNFEVINQSKWWDKKLLILISPLCVMTYFWSLFKNKNTIIFLINNNGNGILFKFIYIENFNGTLEEYIKNGLEEILSIVKVGLSNDDLIGINISAPSMPENGDIGLSFRKVTELSSKIVLDLIESVSQSNSSFKLIDLIENSPLTNNKTSRTRATNILRFCSASPFFFFSIFHDFVLTVYSFYKSKKKIDSPCIQDRKKIRFCSTSLFFLQNPKKIYFTLVVYT